MATCEYSKIVWVEGRDYRKAQYLTGAPFYFVMRRNAYGRTWAKLNPVKHAKLIERIEKELSK